MARVPSHPVSDKKSKIAERLAFQPFTPQQDLINELIRNMINPDTDLGKTYYVGEVLKIIENENTFIDNRDIFYSLTDNRERATKNVYDAKYNADRVTLLVHVPSFITSDSINSNDLNYQNFLKLRVEHDQKKKKIKVGDILKLQFYKQDTFYFPQVIDVADATLMNIDTKKIKNAAKEQFDKTLNCRLIEFTQNNDVIGATDSKSSVKPYGGYVQAIRELDYIYSPTFIESFKRNLSNKFGNKAKIVIDLKNIALSPNVHKELKPYIDTKKFTTGDNTISTFTTEDFDAFKGQEYLLLGKEAIILAEDSSNEALNNELRNLFYSYLKQEFQSKLGYTFTFDNTKKSIVDFQLNINAFLSYGKTEAFEADYIDKSLKTKDSSEFYIKTSVSPSSPQVLKENTTETKCNNPKTTSDNRLYQFVYDGKEYNQEHDKIDQNIVTNFYIDKIQQSQLNNLKYFYQLNPETKNGLDGLTKINSDFYRSGEITNDFYGKKNVTNKEDINNNLNIIINFINQLQINVAANEGLETKNVLIVPRQVLKIKKKGPVSKGEDSNSRHYYGKAVDLAIYLKISDGKQQKIVQIRPEIVLLYAEKIKDKVKIDILGHGLFLQQQTKYYNHIEILKLSGKEATLAKDSSDKYVPLKQDERFFTGNIVDIEKRIEETTTNKLEALKRIIKQSKQFEVPGTGFTDQRFIDLM